MNDSSAVNLLKLKEKKDLDFIKKGIFLAIFAGMTWCLDGFALRKALSYTPLSTPEMWILGPLFVAGLHDLIASIVTFGINVKQGRAKEFFRTVVSKPGKLCILGAVFGAPMGMGGYLMAVSLAGPAYILPITSLFPAIAAILAFFFLKEKISIRAGGGLFMCVLGAIIIGYVPPEGNAGIYFYAGMGFALLAAFGWAAEGVSVTSGMDFVHPGIALNIYQFFSACIYFFIIIPITLMLLHFTAPEMESVRLLGEVFTNGYLLFFIALAGCIAAVSYFCWYRSMNLCGVSRAMALNITYALWGIIFGAIFTDIEITTTLIIGAAIIFGGMFLVIGNPREMINLRKVD